MIKPVEESHVCIIDTGSSSPLPTRWERRSRRTSYYSPYKQE